MSRRPKAKPTPLVAGPPWSGRDWLLAAAIAGSTAMLFYPALGCGFIGYDDNHYVTYNAVVQQGLRNGSWVQFFVQPMVANWHPLTMASHALDCRFYGLDPQGHHRTSVLLHAANAALVFAWLRTATGRFWTPALAALLFAWHPLRVESVVWVAERKDVLSSFFGVLGLLAYGFYVRRGGVGWYLAVVVLLALGLMSKPMLVSFPFVLLLLDYWPYGRWKIEDGLPGLRWLLLEKAPLFAIVAVFCVVTLWVQGSAGALQQEHVFPLGHRALNAVLSYGAYVGQTVWPWPLAVLYPLQGKQLDVAQAGLVLLGLAAVSAWTVWRARARPYLPVGWFWFLGTLVPVIGLVQVGEQAHADRYTYWPHIGLFLAVAWLVADLAQRVAAPWRAVVAGACGAALAALATLTVMQENRWRDTESLLQHTIAHTKDNYIARLILGNSYIEASNHAHAAGDFARQHELLALAAAEFQRGLAIEPDYYKLNRNLGQVFMLQGRHAEAAQQFERALERSAEDAQLHRALAEMRARLREYDRAEAAFRRALELDPQQLDAKAGLASLLADQGRTAEALTLARELPNHPVALTVIAKVQAGSANPTERRPEAALDLANRLVVATKQTDARMLDVLGMALAAQGRFDEAARTARRAIELSDQQLGRDGSGDWRNLSEALRQRLQLYEQREAYLLPTPPAQGSALP